ncbi:hypothetical protein KEM60_03045 [Austwickia sp. TVS 96-490-7B]|uniref:hypothetical protein n=1 Tax=Austwickia sp. TVS 96-490-7B TaxID=2830843 RepID=UPI001C57AA3F|nr:hypothetical protein [Austwickia sp. TVS 96-490-7B]MBW3086816.1 hypothetical protein [Austwickia sp. TVS 96-490-7B]
MGKGKWGLLVVPLVLTACSMHSELSADSEVFKGVDKSAAEEVVNEPGVKQQYESNSDEKIRNQIVQARAYDYQSCRAAYDVLKKWVETGEPGTLTSLTKPEMVTEGFTAINEENKKRIELAAAKDMEGFTSSLVGEMKCGREIPVTPGDYSGEKIEAAVAKLTKR